MDPVLGRLDGVRRSGSGWTARCPAHEDRRASLSVARGWDDRYLLNCHAGCPIESIVAAMGLSVADLFPSADEPSSVSEETTYHVVDGQGTLQARHVRHDLPDGTKRIFWQRVSGERGLDGRSTTSLPLYGSERLDAWDDGEPILLCEGEKVTDALTASGRRALGTVTGAAVVPDDAVLAILTDRDVILTPDNDRAGIDHMLGIATRLAGVARSARWLDPADWPVGGDVADNIAPGRSAASLHRILADPDAPLADASMWARLERRIGEIPATGGAHQHADDEEAPGGSVGSVTDDEMLWPEIEPLLPDAPLPPFPLDVLPDWIADMVDAVAANTQTDPAMAAVTALGLASVPLSNRFEVGTRVWTEHGINLFTAAIADSGELKSAVFDALVEPLRRHEREQRAAELPARRDEERDRKDAEARVKVLRGSLAKAMRDQASALGAAGMAPEDVDVDAARADEAVLEAERQLEDVRDQLHRAEAALVDEEANETTPYALLADDVTQEALQRQMAQQDGRVGIVSAESELFPMAAGRYRDKTPNLQVYLSGFSGEPLRAERITREAPPVEHPGLAIVISVQPVVLEDARRNPYLQRRGLMARFIFALPLSRAGSRRLTDRPTVPVVVQREYGIGLMHLCRLGDAQTSAAPVHLRLGPEATQALERWHDEVLEPRRSREDGDIGASDAMAAWGGRLHGLVLRVAGLLHLMTHFEGASEIAVDLATMDAAIKIGEWSIAHAYAAFGTDRLDRIGHLAIRVRRWYRSRPAPASTFTVRDATRGLQGLDADGIRRAIERLEEHGYLRLRRTDSGPSGGRPSEIVTINPADFAGDDARAHRSA